MVRELSEEDALRDVRDDRGVPHNVYGVRPKTLSFLRNSRSQSGLRFQVYVREGNGKMRRASFLPSRLPKVGTCSRKKVAE